MQIQVYSSIYNTCGREVCIFLVLYSLIQSTRLAPTPPTFPPPGHDHYDSYSLPPPPPLSPLLSSNNHSYLNFKQTEMMCYFINVKCFIVKIILNNNNLYILSPSLMFEMTSGHNRFERQKNRSKQQKNQAFFCSLCFR